MNRSIARRGAWLVPALAIAALTLSGCGLAVSPRPVAAIEYGLSDESVTLEITRTAETRTSDAELVAAQLRVQELLMSSHLGFIERVDLDASQLVVEIFCHDSEAAWRLISEHLEANPVGPVTAHLQSDDSDEAPVVVELTGTP
jgi:hypothetical protein